jgi:EAL domain-containing protein (putative c-di-GMP-specific phosphodiesterase class I)
VSDDEVTDEQRKAVHEVLETRAVKAVFQPIVECATGKIFAHECLARPMHDAFSYPPPLFAAAAAEGVAGQLGRLMRQLAVEGCPDEPLFLNVHPSEFADPWLVRPDDPMFAHEHDVYLEITESVPLTHFDYCSTVLAEVRERGVKLAVDDLGAGYSNLKYIADLHPAIVKLDRELITAVHESKRLMRLVRAIVRLCRDQGADVVGEGIETEDEYTAARDLGVHYAQGWLLAKPASPPPGLLIDPMAI